MAEITAEMVKALRERTGQGMMDCKKALSQCQGDMDAAVEWLRKKGLAQADEKAARGTSEGLVAIHAADGSGAMVEVVCETDFVARNEQFREMVQQVARIAAAAPDGAVEETDQIRALVQDCFGKVKENMRYRRGVRISAPTIGRYVHHNGKVGVLVGIEGPTNPETLNDLCMHIAFANPMAVSREQIDPAAVERERRIASAQAAESGKPAPVVEKIIAGKVGKFLTDNALLEQAFVKDEKKKVKDVLGPAKVTAFARFAVGQE
jgi:elongation factor Ts